MNTITETLLDNQSRDAFRRPYLLDQNALGEWERELCRTLHAHCDYPGEQYAWDLIALSNDGYYLALSDEEQIEDLEVVITTPTGPDNYWLSAQGACLLANLLMLRSAGNAYEDAWKFEMAKVVQEDECRMRQFVDEHPARVEILTCFDYLARLTRKERDELLNRALDAYLYDNDLKGASPLAGDQIVGVMFGSIGEVIEEGQLRNVDAIVEEAYVRVQAEIYEILEQDRIEQWERSDEDDEEACDA